MSLAGTGPDCESLQLAHLSLLTHGSKLAWLLENSATALTSHAWLHMPALERSLPSSGLPVRFPPGPEKFIDRQPGGWV